MSETQELEGNEAPVRGSAPLKNAKHEILARERAAGAIQAKAWEIAGFNPDSKNASRTFSRKDIGDRIEFLRGEFNRMAGLSLAALQGRLLRVADADPMALVEQVKPGMLQMKNPDELSGADRAAVSEVRIGADGVVEIKSIDAPTRLSAVNQLLKTVGGYAAERHEHTGVSGGPMTLEALVGASFQVITGVPRAPDGPPKMEAAKEAAGGEASKIPKLLSYRL